MSNDKRDRDPRDVMADMGWAVSGRKPAPQPAPSGAIPVHAFDPTERFRPYCGFREPDGSLCSRLREHPLHEQPATSGDEARVRAVNAADIGVIVTRLGGTNRQLDEVYDLLDKLQKQAKADGEREERKACEKLARGHTFANRIADAIARRGSTP